VRTAPTLGGPDAIDSTFGRSIGGGLVQTSPSGPGSRTLAPPSGTRDLLPPEAARRRTLVRRMAHSLELHGYSLVTTPPFELAEIVDRGLGGDPRDTLRFVDPETSEVSVFRPDLTVQIARVVASRLTDRPRPLRLYYEGHVLRSRRGRARRQRQIAQIGAECIGIAGPTGDAEVVSLASRTLDAVGLHHTVEISAVPLVRTLTAGLSPERRAAVTDALGRKDRSGVGAALDGARVSRRLRAALLGLESLSGDVSVLRDARGLLDGLDGGHLASVEALCSALARRGASPRLRVDLGEVRGFGYYTGPSFSLLAEGPGEPLGGGGRYDDLIGRLGGPAPATGFAMDIAHGARAMGVQGADERSDPPHVCVVARDPAVAESLRAAGVRVGELEGTLDEAAAYASAWDLDAAVGVRGGTATLRWSGAESERVRVEDLAGRIFARTRTRESES